MGMNTTVAVNYGEGLDKFDCRAVAPNKIRQCIVKCISRMYKKERPPQKDISKALKKIKLDEIQKYYEAGYILVEVEEDGVKSNYIYNKALS